MKNWATLDPLGYKAEHSSWTDPFFPEPSLLEERIGKSCSSRWYQLCLHLGVWWTHKICGFFGHQIPIWAVNEIWYHISLDHVHIVHMLLTWMGICQSFQCHVYPLWSNQPIWILCQSFLNWSPYLSPLSQERLHNQILHEQKLPLELSCPFQNIHCFCTFDEHSCTHSYWFPGHTGTVDMKLMPHVDIPDPYCLTYVQVVWSIYMPFVRRLSDDIGCH